MSARRLTAAAAALALALAGTAPPARAHPHGWIDVEVELRFDGEGQLTGLYQTWLFDEAYTAFVTEGGDLDGDGAPDQEGLEALLHENIGNLAEFDYFTVVERDGRPLGLGTATELSTRMEGARLQIAFLVPLAEPVPARGTPLSYAIYDPTYFIEMRHAESEAPIRLAGAPEGCRFRLQPPNPTADQVALAAALDVNDRVEDGLGALFAEKVVLQCGD